MRIGILGSGLMGGKLGTIFARSGHEVVFSYPRGLGAVLCRVGVQLILIGSLLVFAHPSDAQGQSQSPVTTLDLARLRDIGGTRAGLSISPKAHWALFNLRQAVPERNVYVNEWVLIDLTTKASRILVQDAGPPLLSYGDELPPVDDYNQGIQAFSPVWSMDETKVFYVRKGGDGIRLYTVDVKDGRSAAVPLPEGKVIGLAQDGNTAQITLERPAPAASDMLLRQAITGVQFSGNEFAPVLGLPKLETPTEIQTVRLDLNTGAISKAPGGGEPDACAEFPGWPRDQDLTTMFTDCMFDDGRRPIAIGRDLRAAGRSVALYTATNRKATAISPSYDWLFGPPVRHNGKFYFVAGNGYATSDVYEVSGNNTKRITNSGFFLRNCVFNFAGAPIAVCTAETFIAPREIARINLRDGRIDLLTDLNSEYRKRARPRTTEVEWTDPAGNKLHAIMTYPLRYDSTRRYPAIITSYPHPGFSRGSNGDEFPIPVFAAQGFIVLDVSAPASQYWTAFDISYDSFVKGYESPLRALEHYLRKLGDEGLVDLKYVGICGLSGGANFSAYAVSHSPLFRAAIFDWHESDFLSIVTLGRQRTRDLYARRGLGVRDTANWKDYSLDLRAGHVNAAVLLNVADREFFFAFGSFDALKRNGKAVEMWVYPNAHHVKWLPGQRLTIYDRNVDWFNYWLRGVRDSNPVKAEQYERWDKLRMPRS
jgi:dipeptidyl aminopeptidase/acylaminoacyl peptidase